MTPDQLAVERDRLLEGGRTPEQVERMQRAAAPDIEHAVRRVAEVFENNRRTVSKGSPPYSGDFIWALIASEVSNAMEILSPPETPAGVHAPQPQTPPAGTQCAFCTALALDGHNGMCLACWERGWREAEANGS